jgi:predicted Zn-dependent peptidase
MRRPLAVTLILLAVIILLPAQADAGRVKHPSKLTFDDITLEPIEYEEISFDNDMTGFFIEDREVPIVDIYMLIPTSRAPRDKTGLNELAAWVIRNGGTEEWPAERINEELEFVAARVEVYSTALTAMVHVNCLKKDLDLCLEILGELLKSPSFPEDKIELRRSTMLENIRRENDEPRRIAIREFRKVVYGDHPMAWHNTEETVAAITRDDLVRFHRNFFHPNNAIIGISGDVTRDEVMAALDEAFVGWEPATMIVQPDTLLELSFEPSISYAYKDLNQAVIMIGHLGLNSRNEDSMAVQIMNYVLGGGSFSSRITQKVRTDEGLAYAAYSRYGDDPWTFGTFIASSQTRADAAGRAITLILDIIREMRDDGPTEEEFERARDSYINSFVFEYDSKSRAVFQLVHLKWEGRPLDTPERDIDTITALTLEDVRRAAATYLHPDGLAIMVVGDEDTFDQPLSNFGEVRSIELE